ncbi:Uncharacterised protein [Streptococcus criceti]|nr:hypothetical protein [Streptococcus criceti]SUN43069.1 Uncharacterised protein [Streptococcus criceti]
MKRWQTPLVIVWLIALIIIFPGNWVLSLYGLAWETKVMHIGLILLISSPSLALLLLGKLTWWRSFLLAAVPTLIAFILVTTLGISPFSNYRDQGDYLISEEGHFKRTHDDYHLKRKHFIMEKKVVKKVNLD